MIKSLLRSLSESDLEKLTTDVLRLRYGNCSVNRRQTALLSVKCVVEYLGKSRSLIEAVLNRFFYRLDNPVYRREKRY